MKAENKKYILSLSILTCLTLGIVIGKNLVSWLYAPTDPFIDTVDHLYIGRDIGVYTQNADMIIVGKIKEVGSIYYRRDRGMTSQQNIKIDIQEVLKGDTAMSNVTVLMEGNQVGEENMGDAISFRPDEKVLLFLGTTTDRDYVIFAGPYGKYLIDKDNNVSSIGEFEMPLEDLKAKIRETLKANDRK